jgi:hypothetical protein
MATTKQQQNDIFYILKNGQRGKVINYSTRSPSPFEGRTIANSRKGKNNPTFQKTCWKAIKTNGNNIDFKEGNQEKDH